MSYEYGVNLCGFRRLQVLATHQMLISFSQQNTLNFLPGRLLTVHVNAIPRTNGTSGYDNFTLSTSVAHITTDCLNFPVAVDWSRDVIPANPTA